MAELSSGSNGQLVKAFEFSLVVFVVILIITKSKKSWFDAMTARSLTYCIKFLCILEYFLLFVLIYFCISLKRPLTHTSRDINYYWTFSYARPFCGLITFSMGFFAEMHAIPRWVCSVGCLIQAIADAFSATMVHEYIQQINSHDAPLRGSYTPTLYKWYLYRDLFSFAISILVWFTVTHLSSIVGCCAPQTISYKSIAGGDLDRNSVLNREREKRKVYDNNREKKNKLIEIKIDLSIDHK